MITFNKIIENGLFYSWFGISKKNKQSSDFIKVMINKWKESDCMIAMNRSNFTVDGNNLYILSKIYKNEIWVDDCGLFEQKESGKYYSQQIYNETRINIYIIKLVDPYMFAIENNYSLIKCSKNKGYEFLSITDIKKKYRTWNENDIIEQIAIRDYHPSKIQAWIEAGNEVEDYNP